MDRQFELIEPVDEALFVVTGADAMAVMQALFGATLPAERLVYRAGDREAPQVAACWRPPARLELRVPAAMGSRLREHLRTLRAPARPHGFQKRLRQLLARLEAWSYADSDSGTGPAESMANELRQLASDAPGPGARRAIGQARDALDDGLPAEVIIGMLDRALADLDGPRADQASGLDPSVSG